MSVERWRVPAPRGAVLCAVAALTLLACTTPSTPAPKAAAPAAGQPAAAPAGAAPAPTQPAVQAAPPAPAERIPIRVAYSSLSGNNLALWVAKDGGLFEQQGVEITDFPLIEAGTTAVQALVGGDIQFALAGSSAVMGAELQGADLVMLAGASNTFDFAILAIPEIRTPEEVRGKRVGISRFGSSSDFAVRIGLQRLGLDPERDVTILQIGGTSARLSAMQSGAIEVAPEIAPALVTARKLGFSMLIDLAAAGVPYQVGPVSARRALVAENPDLVRRVVRAYLAGIHRMKTDKDLAFESIRRYTREDDREVLEETWQHFAVRSIPEVPYMTDEALALVRDELAAQDRSAQSVPLSRFYDNRFLREAEDSGFVRQLYGR
jgi:NitT/TauT family transport system substrate-binding protein